MFQEPQRVVDPSHIQSKGISRRPGHQSEVCPPQQVVTVSYILCV